MCGGRGVVLSDTMHLGKGTGTGWLYSGKRNECTEFCPFDWTLKEGSSNKMAC